MRERTQLIEIDLRSGIVSNESLLAIGGLRPPGPSGLPMVGLYRAQNAVWDYRYPRVASGGLPWPRLLQHPITFAADTAKTYTASKSFRDLGYTYNTNISGAPTYLTVMGADTSDVYRLWKAAGGSAMSFDGSAATFTIDASTKRPGCSAYWDTPGNYPTGAVTSGTLGLDYDAATNTITRAAGSFVTDGFVTGRTITITNSTRNDGTYTLTNVAALVLTVSESLVDETAGTSTATQDAASTKGVLVFSHREGNNVYYLMDDATTIRSLTVDVTNCPAGAHALTIHLDRLWLAHTPTSTAGQYSYVYYTDPLNLDSIRTTNVLKIDGRVLCLIPGQFGAIDVSGVPHLIIGTDQGVWCLDGDPQLGGGLQANLRQLTNGVGIPSPLAATVTPYGVFFLGTDGNLWNIPPGCQSIGMVGDPIRDVLGINNVTGAVDSLAANKPTGSVVWFEPYLYIYPGGETSYSFLAEPSPNGLKFWGPHTLTSTITSREAIVKTPRVSSLYVGSASNKEGAHLVHSIDVTPTAAAARFLSFDEFVVPNSGSYPNGTSVGRTASIRTGFINVPGHRVQVMRVILETLRIPLTSTGETPVWYVTVLTDRGLSYAGVLGPEPAVAVGSYARLDSATQHFMIPAQAAARSVLITITVTTEANLSLQRALVELKVLPAQF